MGTKKKKLPKMGLIEDRTLGFQTLMISHHDAALFDRYADAVFELKPTPGGVQANRLQEAAPAVPDALLLGDYPTGE